MLERDPIEARRLLGQDSRPETHAGHLTAGREIQTESAAPNPEHFNFIKRHEGRFRV